MRLRKGAYLDFYIFGKLHDNIRVVDFYESEDGTYSITTGLFYARFEKDYSDGYRRYVSLDNSIWFYN